MSTPGPGLGLSFNHFSKPNPQQPPPPPPPLPPRNMSALHFHFQSHIRLASSTPGRNFTLPRHLRPPRPPLRTSFAPLPRAFSDGAAAVADKPSICTADELHYVSIPNSDWRLALWRYHPPPQAPPRNHPLLLLSGLGTNAIGYDLSPESSFARYMSGQGFDTWILEFRGAGLSVQTSNFEETKESAVALSDQMVVMAQSVANGAPQKQPTDVSGYLSDSEFYFLREDSIGIGTAWDEAKLVAELTEIFMRLSEGLSGFLSEGQSRLMSTKLLDQISKLLEDSQLSERFGELRMKLSNLLEKQQNSGIASQIRDLSQTLVNIIEGGQRSVSPQFIDIQERLSSTIEDFQKQLDLIVKYDWDFDHYLEEDVPAAMEYIRAQTKPKDGKLLAIGHSMGGILLYAMLSRCGSEGREPGLNAVATMASALDYRSSKPLKVLLPLADPAQALNVPAVPFGSLLAAAYPLASHPPYVLGWLNSLISAEDMMHPKLLEKLILNNFCTIPTKLIFQLTSAFGEKGLCDRSGKFSYRDHLNKCSVPVLAIAGDQDLICPPEAVEETVKFFPENLVTYKIFGEHHGPHYAHYDLVGGRLTHQTISILKRNGQPAKQEQCLSRGITLCFVHKRCEKLRHCSNCWVAESNQTFVKITSAIPCSLHVACIRIRPAPGQDKHPSIIGYGEASSSHKKSLNTGYSELAPKDCDDEAEGVQSKERWAYVKVNMDGVLVGRKVCMLDHGGYLGLARQLEEMFGRHTASGLRLFEFESDFLLFYKDDMENAWKNVGDVPWKEFVERVKRLRICRKNEVVYRPCSSSFN
ncbi:hypothetical protein V6N13_012810 [Hibiscus sabdariffa]